MMFSRFSLRARLILAMAASSLFTIVVIVVGMSGFYLVTADLWIERLSPEHRATLESLESGETVTAEDLAYLVSTHTQDWATYFADAEGYALLICSALALILAVLVAYRVALRISRPVEAVSQAARTVAAGTLEARAEFSGRSSQEIEQLVRDFNALAIELERADRELSAGAAAIAHEFRTPLTVLKGRLQGLKDGVFEYSPELMETLIGHVDGLSLIVEDMRTLGLSSAGQLELDLQEFELDMLVGQTLEGFDEELKAAGMAVTLDLTPSIVEADRDRIRQALVCLLDNARRYAANGRELTVSCSGDAEHARVEVLDRGDGVLPEDAQRMFDRFWRADPSRSRALGGSGLGLAVVKAIMTAHGGDVTCQAREGGGLHFSLLLSCRSASS